MATNTYVFIDLETHDLFMPKITEICLIAVTRDHILEANKNKEFNPPRALNKLSLCISPQATIHPRTSEVTGLSNEMLEAFPVFNAHVVSSIQTFLQLLPEPVCMVAHNGFKFDFPVLKGALYKLNQDLPIPVRCCDTLPGFKKVFSNWSNIANDAGDGVGTNAIRNSSKIVTSQTLKSSNNTNNVINGTSVITIKDPSKIVNNEIFKNTSNHTIASTSSGSNKNRGIEVVISNDSNDQATECMNEEASQSINQTNLLNDGNDGYFVDIDCDQLMADADAYEYFSQIIEPSDVDFDIRQNCSQLSWDRSARETPKRARVESDCVNSDKLPEVECIDVETNTVIINGKAACEAIPPLRASTRVEIRKDLFPFSSPPPSYKLIDVYERLRHSRPVAHRAEADVIMMLECVLVMGVEILQYFDDNFMLFEDVKILNYR